MSVIFSSISAPYSVDYIVTSAGICILPDDGDEPFQPVEPALEFGTEAPIPALSSSQVAPLDVGCAENTAQSEKDNAEEDEWENYWGADDLQEQDYNNLDLEALSAPNPSG